jgi:hypothetical protein
MRPPAPSIDPSPKAKARRHVRTAAYEDEAHPSVQQFWSNIPASHPYRGHPVLTPHGQALSKESYDFTDRHLEGAGRANAGAIWNQIQQLEAQHHDELIELAQKITQTVWGLPPTEKVEGELGKGRVTVDEEQEQPTVDTGYQEQEQPDFAEPEAEVPMAQVRDQVHKRTSLNALTQGAAVNIMYKVHLLEGEALNRIDPRLLRLYSQFAGVSMKMYWDGMFTAFENNVQGLEAGQVGECRVTYPKAKPAEPAEPQDPNAKSWKKPIPKEEANPAPRMQAAGVVFPVLVQEMSKAVMEHLTSWGSAGIPKNELTTIQKHADRKTDEPWLIQVGPAIWRKFLDVVTKLPEKKALVDYVAAVAQANPTSMHAFLEKLISNPGYAGKMIQELMKQQDKNRQTPPTSV